MRSLRALKKRQILEVSARVHRKCKLDKQKQAHLAHDHVRLLGCGMSVGSAFSRVDGNTESNR